jgi:hypothetical protein
MKPVIRQAAKFSRQNRPLSLNPSSKQHIFSKSTEEKNPPTTPAGREKKYFAIDPHLHNEHGTVQFSNRTGY